MEEKTMRISKIDLNTKYEKYIPEFTQYLEQVGSTDRTVESYICYIRVFFTYLESQKQNIERLDQITRKDIIDYQTYIFYVENEKGQKYSIPSQVRVLTAVKSFFRFMLRKDYLLYNPASDFELPKEPQRIPRNILTEKEIVEVLQTPDMNCFTGIRDRAIIEVLYSTGIRASELCNLTIYDIFEDDGILRIIQGKGRKDRMVAIGKTALKYMKYYITGARAKFAPPDDNQGILFIAESGRKFTRQDLASIVKNIMSKTTIKKHVSCHTLRHTCATHLLKHKANIRYIQEQLGHRSLRTTQKYMNVDITDLKAVHKRCHPREKLFSAE